MDLIIILSTIILLAIIFRFLRHDPKLPPCPAFPLPVIGHLLFLKEDSRAQFKQWRDQLGDVFSFYMGRNLVVVVSGYDTIKELFVSNGDHAANRPDMFFDTVTGYPKKGVIMSVGQEWKEQRSVTLSILKKFGMGKNILAEKIQEEAICYMDALAELRGKPTNIRALTNISTSNIVCSVMIGQRFQYNDKVFLDLMTTLDDVVTNVNLSNYATYFPFIKYFPGDFYKIKKIRSAIRTVMDLFVNKFVQDNSKETADDNANDNFIAAYYREWRQKIKSGEETTMSEENLIKIIWDIFNAGTVTASTTILWCILYCLNYPEVQDKIFAEIEAEMGTERLPAIQDKAKLVYLNAVIMETQRLASVSSLSLPREATRDITINNYTIPKGTAIHTNLDSVLYDEKIWGNNVDTFKPERFIDENGKLKTSQEFIPFGIGKRICPGEGWTKVLLFLYLSAMFQRFKFVPPNPASPPPAEYVYGLDVMPIEFEVRVINRKKNV